MPQTSPMNWIILSNMMLISSLVSTSIFNKELISMKNNIQTKIFLKTMTWLW